MELGFELDLENADWDPNLRYPSAGFPAQPFKTIIPAEISPITTPRLRLRIMEERDAEGIAALKDMPEHLRHLYGGIGIQPTIEGSRKWMQTKKLAEPPSLKGRWIEFVITRRDDPAERIVGSIGFNRLIPVPNIGYAIQYDFWGKGYATEAIGGLLGWWWSLPREGEGDGRREAVLANVNKANIGSLRALEKNGFRVYNEHFYEEWKETLAFLAVVRPDV